MYKKLQYAIVCFIFDHDLQQLKKQGTMEGNDQTQSENKLALLKTVIKGGRKGREAINSLRRIYHLDIIKITCEYPPQHINLLMMQVNKAFKTILREYIYDHEVMDANEFEEFLATQLRQIFSKSLEKKYITQKAFTRRNMDPMHAMLLMTRLYMDNCGISLTERTMAYDAGWIWLDEYNKAHPDEKRWDANTPFVEVMPIICKDYISEIYGGYDVGSVDLEDKIHYAYEMIQEMDEETAFALCHAIVIELWNKKKPCVYQLVKVVIDNEGMLDTSEMAMFLDKEEAEEEMMRWTTHQPETLLCHVIRELPVGRTFSDGFQPVDRDLKQGWQEMTDVVEHVYSPQGFERKWSIRKGNRVEYIFHDAGLTYLGKGVVKQAPTKEENYCIILDDESSTNLSDFAKLDCAVRIPTRYVFPLRHFKTCK